MLYDLIFFPSKISKIVYKLLQCSFKYNPPINLIRLYTVYANNAKHKQCEN